MKHRAALLLLLLAIPSLACYGTITPSAPSTPSAAPSPITPAQVIKVTNPQPPTNTPAPACTVSAESLNIRSAPEGGLEESRVLAWLHAGDLVTIRETRGAWLHVTAGNVSGWINSTYCKGSHE